MKRHAKVRTAGSTTRWAPSPRGNRIAFVCILALLTCVGTGASSASAASAPTIDEAGAVQITDTSARLVAVIDPGEAETGYVFKYGPTPALGGETEPATIAAGSTPVIVSQLIEGLAPETTYSFQVVVVNGEGDDTSVTQTFKTRKIASPGGPDRAYEMVTNFDKGGNHVTSAAEGGWLVSTALDGEAVALCAVFASGQIESVQTPSGRFCGDYVMRRGDEQWKMQPAVPRFCGQDLVGTGGNPGLFGTSASITYSPNLDRAALSLSESASCDIPPLDPKAPTPSRNLYLSDLLASPGGYQLLTPEPSPSATDAGSIAGALRANSIDFTRLVYRSDGRQAEGIDPAKAPVQRLFEWHDGVQRVISRDTDNGLIESASDIAGGVEQKTGYRPMSDDGQIVFFQNLAPNGLQSNPTGFLAAPATVRLLMRENGAVTYNVGESECTVTCGAASGDVFQWGSASGRIALFFSREKLRDEDTDATAADLYMYRHSESPSTDRNLFLLSKDNEPADGTAAGYRGLLGASEDGNVVYFVATGQIVAGAPTGNSRNVYRWQWNKGDPLVTYLGSVVPSAGAAKHDETNWAWNPSVRSKSIARRVSEDGSYLFLDVVARLDPFADRDNDFDVYRWSQAEGWICLSCQKPDAPSDGEASSGYGVSCPTAMPDCRQLNVPQEPRRRNDFELVNFFRADGEQVFFVAQDKLVPTDENDAQDVYEWHEGRLRLISPGDAEVDSYLIEASPSGRDVFFITEQPLVGWDVDALQDIYVARSGGGQPEPPPAGAPCEGEVCKGEEGTGLAGNAAGSVALVGPGNVKEGRPRPKPRKCRKGTVKRTIKGKARCVSKQKAKKKRGKAARQAPRHARKGASK